MLLKLFNWSTRKPLALPFALLFWCALSTAANAQSDIATEAIFTVQAEDHRAIVRVITRAPVCPGIEWDAKAAVAMTARAMPATVPTRSDAAQKESKPAIFDVLTCEAYWQIGATKARIAGQNVPAPKAEIKPCKEPTFRAVKRLVKAELVGANTVIA